MISKPTGQRSNISNTSYISCAVATPATCTTAPATATPVTSAKVARASFASYPPCTAATLQLPQSTAAAKQCLAHLGNACTTATAIRAASTDSNLEASTCDSHIHWRGHIDLSASHRYHMSKRSGMCVLAPSALTTQVHQQGKPNLSHCGLSPARVPYWREGTPTLRGICISMAGRAGID